MKTELVTFTVLLDSNHVKGAAPTDSEGAVKVYLSPGQRDVVAAGRMRGTPAERTEGVVEPALSPRSRILPLFPAFVLVD